MSPFNHGSTTSYPKRPQAFGHTEYNWAVGLLAGFFRCFVLLFLGVFWELSGGLLVGMGGLGIHIGVFVSVLLGHY